MATRCAFTSLPAEIRNRIYSHLLPRFGFIELSDGRVGVVNLSFSTTRRELLESLAIYQIDNTTIRNETSAVAARKTDLMFSFHSWIRTTHGLFPHRPRRVSSDLHNIRVLMLVSNVRYPPSTQLLPQLQTLVEARLTVQLAQSQSVPTKSSIIRELTHRYLDAYGSRCYDGWVTRFFHHVDRPAPWGRIWVRTAYLALAPGTVARVPASEQEWQNRTGDIERYQEVWVCLDDGRFVSRYYTGEELRNIGLPVRWMNTFQDFWYDTLS